MHLILDQIDKFQKKSKKKKKFWTHFWQEKLLGTISHFSKLSKLLFFAFSVDLKH